MKYFKTYENCIVTSGYKRSLISDLQFGYSEFIPNSMAEIIKRLNSNFPIDLLYEEFDNDDREIIKEYILFLESKSLGQYYDDHDILRFSEMEKSFSSPEDISNIIIEAGIDPFLNLNRFVSQENLIFCKNLCLIFYENLTAEELYQVKKIIEASSLYSVEIIIKYNHFMNEEFIKMFGFEFSKLTKLYIHSAPFNKEIFWEGNNLIDTIFSKKKINNFKSCGSVKSLDFGVNIPKFTEALNYNSCLHKKIAIDKDGNICNCPAMNKSYGNIKDTTLDEVIFDVDFKKYWNLTKDYIEVCKDCEFRYICTDCRGYTERTHTNGNGLDISKPLKCGYNPYTGEWEDWSTNSLKEKAIKYYEMQDLIREIN
ncbi:grasp-with-spasm system SPASM domain peptide maturase [Chryseobacterium sp. S-02]|uniref:grasp-with-spasm system SPASM domain peptide maturase n=1 Tax=Chryseobacterium sp. S-02 TaxID=3404064 RepID=UPI003CE9D141